MEMQRDSRKGCLAYYFSEHVGSTSQVFLSLCFEIPYIGHFWQCMVKTIITACVEQTYTMTDLEE